MLMFLVMAVVLALRPHGLLGRRRRPGAPGRRAARPAAARALRPPGLRRLALAPRAPLVAGAFALAVAHRSAGRDAVRRLPARADGPRRHRCFGHAAWFGIGAYAAALAANRPAADAARPVPAGPRSPRSALAFGWFAVRLSGIYLAMLTLALAQIVWAVAFQWAP